MRIQHSDPWYADFVNYIACGVFQPDIDYHQKKKFLWDSRQYFCDEPYLYKKCGDGLLRRCIPDEKSCKSSSSATHLSVGDMQVQPKLLQKFFRVGFIGPLSLKMQGNS